MSRPSLSLAMICKNERHNLPVLFASIKDCFDEVHVTDTGSTDGTLDYLSDLVKTGQDKEVLGCSLHLHFFEWVHDFAAARNFAFSQCKTDYVMWLDGDDSLGNRENFILWRDNAMGLADYWLATYNYAYDDQGKPICSFARERVIKNVPNPWAYFVHEGIRPVKGWRPQYVVTWTVNHRRSIDDLKRDKGRNLAIFEKHKGNFDTRMLFYYGKELFENGQHLEAFNPLMDAISRENIEMHDRILGIQYACFSALQCNQGSKAIQLAHQGLMLDQNRAEFYGVIGDAYLQTGNLKSAVPFFAAAKACFNNAPAGAKYQGAIYNHEMAYGVYPTEQLAKIYYAMCDFDKSEIEAKYGIEKYNSNPCKDILAKIKEARDLTAPPKEQIVDTDEIVFTTSPQGAYPWDSKIYKTTGLGGSETACVEMATWLKRLTGKKVIVFNPREDIFEDEYGVSYRPIKDVLAYFAKYRPKLHVAWRHNSKITDAYTVSWCHDLVLHGAELGLNADKIMCLTEFHKNYVRAMQGIPEEKIIMTRNGIDVKRFDGIRKKDPNKVIFSSSPDRGLDRAILVVEEARKTLPNLELHVFYGMENLEKYGLGELAKKLKAMIADRPWVKYHGNVDQKRLAKEMMSAGTTLYVPDFIESFFITGLELMAAGCYLVTRKIGAIQNTMRPFADMGLCTILDMAGDTDEQRTVWAKELVEAIQLRKWEKNTLDDAFWDNYTWESVAREWIKMFDLEPRKRTLSPIRDLAI